MRALLLLSCLLAASRADDLQVGARDRFWRHNVQQKTLIHEGVDQYDNIQKCLRSKLTDQERNDLATQRADRQPGLKLRDPDEGIVIATVIKQAIHPSHAKAVQSLAACVREYMPSLYESRAMYQEMNLDEDDGSGGNCPTHLAPLVSIFLPEVVAEMQRTLEMAYAAADWSEIVEEEREEGISREHALPEPKDVGIRASELLTYKDFPLLAPHTDGSTAYTMNFAFVEPEEYDGGAFYIISGAGKNKRKSSIKPAKYDCLVFLGGRYLHGVNEITGGHREMFSTEYFNYPDIPFGITLWTNTPGNMEEYIRRCNREQDQDAPCQAEYPRITAAGMDLDDVKKKYDDLRPNRVQPKPLTPVRFRDEFGNEFGLEDFREEEHDFLVPKELKSGEMVPIRWRRNLRPVDDTEGESFVIGLPPELLTEFQDYVEKSGMMKVAKKILYDEEFLEPGEHRIYTLEDGNKWGAMIQGQWDTDMVWLDPADETCFESLLSMLGRGSFDTVLEQIGMAFDLNGLMVQGVGAIFLSEYDVSRNMHKDIPGSKGSFYNVIVPIHIPEDDVAQFYVGDDEYRGTINLRPDVGVVLGGESMHGTGECNYREKQDFRLSFAIYVADINEDNIDLIASDSTSLWPTDGDVEWFRSQQGRLWSKDGDKSLRNDQGRKPLPLEEDADCPSSQHLCESDPLGVRIRCPKTCNLYIPDDVYSGNFSKSQPSCPSNEKDSPSCPSSLILEA